MTSDTADPTFHEPHDHDEQIIVRVDPEEGRLLAVRGTQTVGIMVFERTRKRFTIVHTVTDPAHRGEGVASVLVRTAFAEARAASLAVVVICPFVESWLQRHPNEATAVIDGD